MQTDSPLAIDKRQLRRQRARAVPTFDLAAVLPRTVGDQLIARLDVVRMQPERILDIGAASGDSARRLARRYRGVRLIGLDPAPEMAAVARRKAGWFARRRFVAGDVERLPFGDASFDLVASNLTLQWYDPQAAFPEIRRVLRPGGLFVFTSLGPDTLQELRHAWREADEAAHVHAFLDMHDVGDVLIRAGFADPVMDVERYVLTYADVGAVLRELKALGAQHAASGRRRGLTGRARFERFRRAYAAFATEGRVPASVEVVYGHAWVPENAPRRPPPGRPVIPIRRAPPR